jgi:hypothetical protein
MLALLFVCALVIAAAIGKLVRRVAVVLALVIGVFVGLVASALGRQTFEVVALSSLPLLGVSIAGTISATARDIRALRKQRTPDERETAMRLRRERRERLRAAQAEEDDIAA